MESLNPQISELGLREGMVLRVPGETKGFRIENDLLVEKLSLDSINDLKLLSSGLLPFKANEMNTTPLKIPRNYYKKKFTYNIHEFYSGFCLYDTLSKGIR